MRVVRMITHIKPVACASSRERSASWPYRTLLLIAVALLQGCGLVYDAVTTIHPLSRDELSSICTRGRLRVGISVEPFRPFIFPAMYTDEGIRVTGLDIELIREVADTLTVHCGRPTPIVPTLHVTRFPDLFIKMNEGQLDLFVSSVSGTVPGTRPTGLWFSAPYFRDDGIAAIVQKPEIAERIRTQFRKQNGQWDTLAAVQEGFAGLTVAVQKGRSAHLYAQANLKQARLVVCDSLPAAIETKDPKIDVILAKHAIIEYVTKRVWQGWHPLTRIDGTPVILTRDDLSIVTSEEHRHLQWFLNNLLFRLEESGRLKQMRTRWIEAEYAPTRRATTEGLPLEVTQVPDHYDQGQCRLAEEP
ncbi:MAG: transporter substrate-binding domain-containing protein [Nitrospira sp.]|nr:transporter substrate-binding domain-containing protein [Nitrospira sp.]